MAIVCTGCGRQYDVTLFQLGRTIHCTCGRRVGLEHRLTVTDDAAGPPEVAEGSDVAGLRFIADAMLGRLARWLRTLGHDTAHDDTIADENLVRRAFDEKRHILTRDRKLFEEWRIDGLLIESDGTLDQLREVVDSFDLPRPARLFTRCRECNEPLEPVELSNAEGRVPGRVLGRLRREAAPPPGETQGRRETERERQAEREAGRPSPEEGVDGSRELGPGGRPIVARCPDCGRVYWEGSHTERMRRVVDRVFGG